jgi:DmsE family decaheme c-type cytochrome
MGKVSLIKTLSLFFLFLFLIFSFANRFISAEEGEVSEQCIVCHDEIAKNLEKTVHRVSLEGKEKFKNSCTSCHLNWEKHIQEPSSENIFNPAKKGGFEVFKVCSQCHLSAHSQEFAWGNVHFRNQINCTACHSIHHSEKKNLVVSPANSLCFSCHPETRPSFSNTTHHPVNEGVVKCVDCHNILQEPGKAFSFDFLNEKCFQCHQEFQGPFPYEHKTIYDFTLEKTGCVACHDPHGSPNPKLLKQPGNSLCLQCHIVPKHQTAHGGIWANRTCQNCHADIHGSYQSRKLFPEDLFGGECFDCHTF